MNDIAVLSFYSFTQLKPENLKSKIFDFCNALGILGTVLLAEEGINGSISGKESDLLSTIEFVKTLGINDINVKTNFCTVHPFSKLKIRIKPEIVAMKSGNIDVNNMKGEYVFSNDWDNFIKSEDVVLVDTRNDYEYTEGTFKGAINPNTETFREFPQWVKDNEELLSNKKVAMFCTGGIRCEKATAYLKSVGIKNVYHLYGGILQYLEDTKNQTKSWVGNCFVFDDRFSVNESLQPKVDCKE